MTPTPTSLLLAFGALVSLLANACGEREAKLLPATLTAGSEIAVEPADLFDGERKLIFEIGLDPRRNANRATYQPQRGKPREGDDDSITLQLFEGKTLAARASAFATEAADGSMTNRLEVSLPLRPSRVLIEIDGIAAFHENIPAQALEGELITTADLTVTQDDPTEVSRFRLVPTAPPPPSYRYPSDPGGIPLTSIEWSHARLGEPRAAPNPLSTIPSEGTQVTFRVLDEDGVELLSRSAEVLCDVDEVFPPVDGCRATSAFVVPPAAASVVATVGSDDVARLDPGRGAPELLTSSPDARDVLEYDESLRFEWNAIDDGDAPLYFIVQGQGIDGWGSYDRWWDQTYKYLPARPGGTFRLLMSDGLHINFGELATPRWKPGVWIRMTGDGALPNVIGGNIVAAVSPNQFVEWSTERLGVVSNEPTISLELLGRGHHTLTVRVIGENGLENSDTIEFSVCGLDDGLVAC